MTLCTAAENGDKQGLKAATDALAEAWQIRFPADSPR